MPAARGADAGTVLEVLLQVISEKTGYETEELELDYELEADLGIDTVKQAEIFAEVREKFGVERDDSFSLADYPTISALARWLTSRVPGADEGAEEVLTVALSEDDAPLELPVPEVPVLEVVEEDREPDELPAGFQLRRPIWSDRPLGRVAEGSLDGRVIRVLGAGRTVAEIRREIERRGGLTRGRPDAVIDAGAEALEAFEFARGIDFSPPADWICLALYSEGDSDPHSAAFEGARAGLAKALGREWPGTRARVLELDPSLGAERVARLVCDELELGDAAAEIRRDGRLRAVRELERLARPPRHSRFDEQVVLVTGGARGVTARVAIELARRGAKTLVIAGRSAPGELPLDEAAERARLKAALRDAGKRASPAAVDRELAPLKKAEEARRNLAAMAEAGAEVLFRRCDTADPEAVHDLVRSTLEACGRLDGCVHGAGAEESRPLAEKDAAIWRRIYDGKARGGVALSEHLPEGTWLLSMGSVAGRFGNAGQVDYCAANEAMAQVCRVRGRSLHVDWTAWDDVGMAVRGGMRHLLTERGVQLLPAEAGAAIALDLVADALWGEIVVAGALGDMEPAPSHPLIDGEHSAGEGLVAHKTLTVEGDPWIADHAIRSVPLLPGAVGVELMAAAARRLEPGQGVAGLADVRFEHPLKLYRGQPAELDVSALPWDGGDRVRCAIRTARRAKTGRKLETVHFTGTVLLGAPEEPSPLPDRALEIAEIGPELIYRRFFHGPSFQVLSGVDAASAEGLEARGRVDHAPLGPGLLAAPLVLELAFQAAGLHRMMAENVMALPAGFERLHLLRPAQDGEELRASVLRRADGAYDVDIVGPEGLVMALRGFRTVEAGPVPEGDGEALPGWPDAAIGSARAGEGGGGALSGAERAALSQRGSAARIADRIAGRIAAKRAIRALTGADFADIRVESLPSGEPVATVGGAPGPRVSISHSGGRAVAIASRGRRVGLDLEAVRERHPSFAREWFSEAEQARWAQDPRALTTAWCAKEAVLKALGDGMASNPREIELVSLDGSAAEVRLHGAVAARHAALGGGPLEARILDAGHGGVLVAVRLAA